jgi:hypothetical protein
MEGNQRRSNCGSKRLERIMWDSERSANAF